MSLDLLTQYIEHALTFERMADAEPNKSLKADLERQAAAWRPTVGSPQIVPENSVCLDRAFQHVVNMQPSQMQPA